MRRRRSHGSTRLYRGGADPLLVLQDLLDLSHFLTRLKLAPEAGAGDPIAEGDRERARPLAEKLSMPVLARAWQMLLKGLGEVQAAPVADPGRRDGAGPPRLCRRSAGRRPSWCAR